MWHEARKREKATQKLLIDHRRRAEKRREENRVDPSSFLQVNGVKAKLCLDPNVYKQATASMVAWQGDPKVTIDRFDVRTTLDSIPKDDIRKSRDRYKQGSRDSSGVLDADESRAMKTLLNYERYRLLMQDDLHGFSEESRLGLLAKSDIISDAKMRKLKGNTFGTSGETSSFESNQTTNIRSLTRAHSKVVTSGPSYNSVPPPINFLEKQRSDKSNVLKSEEKFQYNSVADNIIDLDDYDNFDSDIVDIKENNKQTNDVAKKYGLSSDELLLLSRLDNKAAPLEEALRELKSLAEKFTVAHRPPSQEVYGPALPPNLITSSNQDESSNDSPVAQRSPSGAVIPIRENSRDRGKEKEDSREGSIGFIETTSNIGSQQSGTTKKVEAISHRAEVIVSNQTNDKSVDVTDGDSIPLKNGTIGDSTKPTTDTRRRASTPLAYKRNRRSSRSLSRERRSRRKKTSSHKTRYRRRSSSSSSSTSKSSQRSMSSKDSSSERSSRYKEQIRRYRSRKRVRDR